MASRFEIPVLFTVLVVLGRISSAADQPRHDRVQLRQWKLQSACELQAGGEKISAPDFSTAGWHSVEVPSTVVGGLVADHTLPDPYFGANITTLPGYSNRYDLANAEMPDNSPYRCSWWYRTEFASPTAEQDRTQWLHFDGINYRANIWLNGKRIADSKDVVGAFRAYEFNLKDALAEKQNVLAVEVMAPRADDLGITWWDWSPTPPDKDMGLWKDVYLSANGPVSLRYPFVTSKLAPSLKSAELTMQVEARNDSSAPVKGNLRAEMDGIKFEQPIELAVGEKRTIRFTPDRFSKLRLSNPKLWWPYQLGTPNLHNAAFTFETGGEISDTASVRFGIREVSSELDANKNLIFKVNGRRVFIKGGGWASDMLLRQWPKRLRDEFAHIRQLNLNTIRLEGKMETDAFFDLADEQGILVMAGWMCCDRWQLSEKWMPETHAVATESMRTQSLRLRSHPSMLAWLYGSDEPAPEATEREYLQVLKETEWPNPALSSASATPSPLTGPSGLKMSGPYDYVPPSYWLNPKTQNTSLGGGFGFNSETSPGPAIPTVQSLKKMLPADHLWPIDQVWNVHAGGNEFSTLNLFNKAMDATYGRPKDLNDYERKAQAMAYNGERAMFEAYSGNRYTSGGVIQWMLNNAWPSMIWHLYDYYLQAAGGYFGTRKANEPVHVQYSYGDRSIVVVNNQSESLANVTMNAELYDQELKKLFAQQKTISVPPDSSTHVLAIPQSQAKVSFLKLTLRDNKGQPLSDNFYWLSADEPTFAWDKTTFVNTPSPHYEDLSALNELPEVELKADTTVTAAGNRRLISTVVANPSKNLAFQVVLRVFAKHDGSDILPVLWDDNYFSLLPGESTTVRASIAEEDLHGAEPAVEVGGWNVKTANATLENAAPSKTPAGKTVQERLGYPANARLLIIHADDLGMNHSVNRATFEALEKHWITSSSIMVPCPWFPEVARFAQSHPDADLGIHLALNSEWTDFRWGPVSAKDRVPSLLDQQGYFPLLETVPAQQAKLPEVNTELHAQIERARASGIRISHLDTHMTALMQSPGLLGLYEDLGNEYKLPILLDRSGSRVLPPGVTFPEKQALVDSIIEISPGVAPDQWTHWYEQTLAALKPGVYLMIVHLAHDDDEMRGATWDHPDWGSAWRQHDLDMVSSSEFQQFLKQQNLTLVKWSDVAKALQRNDGSMEAR